MFSDMTCSGGVQSILARQAFHNSNGSSILRMVRAAEGNQPKVVQVEFWHCNPTALD